MQLAASTGKCAAKQPISRRAAVVVQCSSQQAAPWRQAASIAGAAVLSIAVACSPILPAAEAKQSTLADLTREAYGFVDKNSDGLITAEELRDVNKTIAQEEGVPLVGEDQLNFSMRLWDLNQDGRVETDEMLTTIALDGAVDTDAIDQDVYQVFDRNGNGTIEQEEFMAALGDLGANGEQAKQWIFARTNWLSEGNGRLDPSQFGNALIVARTALLGY